MQNDKLSWLKMLICCYIVDGVNFLWFPGEVFDYLVAHGRMKEKEARAKFRQVCFYVCVFFYLLHIEYQNTHFLGHEDIFYLTKSETKNRYFILKGSL